MTDVAETEGGPCQCEPCREKAKKWYVRTWRWLASLDLTKPPAPLLRWLGILLVGIVYAAAGAPTTLSDWLWAAILGGILILPDVAGFAIGGFRLDLQQAQDEIAALKLRIDVRQQNVTNVYGALERTTEVQTGEDAPKRRRVIRPPVDDMENGDLPL